MIHETYYNHETMPFISIIQAPLKRSFSPLHTLTFLFNSHERLYFWHMRIKSNFSLRPRLIIADWHTLTPFSLHIRWKYISFIKRFFLSIAFCCLLVYGKASAIVQTILYKIFIVKVNLYCYISTCLKTF